MRRRRARSPARPRAAGEGRGSSARSAFSTATTCEVGATSSRSPSSPIFSMWPSTLRRAPRPSARPPPRSARGGRGGRRGGPGLGSASRPILGAVGAGSGRARGAPASGGTSAGTGASLALLVAHRAAAADGDAEHGQEAEEGAELDLDELVRPRLVERSGRGTSRSRARPASRRSRPRRPAAPGLRRLAVRTASADRRRARQREEHVGDAERLPGAEAERDLMLGPEAALPPASTSRGTATTSSATPPRPATSSPSPQPAQPSTPPDREAAARLAASSVLRSSIAIVIGPTPPGTGVIRPARSARGVEVDVADEPVVGAVDPDVDHRRRPA